MTFQPVSMTMNSADCPTPYSQAHQRNIVVDRLKQRLSILEKHKQTCADRYAISQRTLRENEKRDTVLLWQKMQELQNKKGGKCKLDSRQKTTSIEHGDNDTNNPSYLARVSQSLKRKMQMGSEENQGYNETPNGQQQESKKLKNDQTNNMNNNRIQQEYPNVSVQIVQNFGNDSSSTTVNVHSNRNISDSQSVSVNIGSKNIKQEMMQDSRQGQQQQQQMNQQNMNPCPGGNSESGDLGGLFEDDINLLFNLVQQMPEDMVSELLSPDGQPPMTSQSQNMTSQYPSQQQQMTPPMQPNMTSPGQQQHNMTSPMTSSQMMQQQNARLMCKSEKVDMFPGFHGNSSENKQEPRGIPRQNSHGATPQNISANILTQQSLRVGANNFSANLSSQHNISLNMSTQPQNNNFPTNGRHMSTNNNNMTSQHIHRLNQVAQFAPQDAPPEPPRLFHPPASTQPSYYEHSQQLKQLAEKRGYGSMSGSGPMHMNSDIRSTQTFSHYRGGDVPPMTQQMNMPNHPMSSGSQRLSHMDANIYSRSSQFVQSQRPGMNMMMQQEAIMRKQYQMQNNQHGYYSRVPDPQSQQVLPTSPNIPFPSSGGPHHPSWSQRGVGWPSSQNPLHRSQVTSDQMHRPQITPEQMYRTQVNPEQMQRPQMNSNLSQSNNCLPEYDQDLNIIEEILNKAN